MEWGGQSFGEGRRVQEKRMGPSLRVRDELTAQLLFQLHGLFENNVMSFITDNPRKWLLWQPGKRMALRSQSEVPALPPVCTNSFSPAGERGGQEIGQVKGPLIPRQLVSAEFQAHDWLFLPQFSTQESCPMHRPGNGQIRGS